MAVKRKAFYINKKDIVSVEEDLKEQHKHPILDRKKETKRIALFKAKRRRPDRKRMVDRKKTEKRRNICDIEPKGTMKELNDEYLRALEYEIKLVDYSSRDELISEEELDTLRRIIHFNKQGPNYKKSIGGKDGTLRHADVLYILTDKNPIKYLAKRFEVSVQTIRDLRRGKLPQWSTEYHLVRRLRRSVICKYKKYFKEPFITVLTDVKQNKKFYFTSPAKAEAFRKEYSYNRIPKRLSHSYSNKTAYRKLVKSGKINEILPIEEEMIIK